MTGERTTALHHRDADTTRIPVIMHSKTEGPARKPAPRVRQAFRQT